MAYAEWYSLKTNKNWRLPFESEWEKAAKGVDGRSYPWGDYFDPTWCSMRHSKRERPYMSSIYDYPLDKSPYGVYGMAGNVREWTATSWNHDGPHIQNDCVNEDMPTLHNYLRVTLKGGSWSDPDIYCRASSRTSAGISRLDELLGFRLVQSLEG